MSAKLEGKVAIVTGGGGGLGSAQASLLAKEGAKLVVTDIDEAQGKQVAEKIGQGGGEAIFVKHDVSSEQDWRNVIEKTLSEFGKLDVLVNNAGIIMFKSIDDTSLDDWRQVIRINLDGVFLGTKYAMGAMKKSGGGSIINLSSTAGIVGTLDTASYHASKGGVRIFTKAAALECSKAGYDYNIRVNSVHPGVIKTNMTKDLLEDDEAREMVLNWHPIGHVGEPDDIAYGILYLASDESKFITGSELVIDGGWTAR